MKSSFSRPSRPPRADHPVEWLGRQAQSANIVATAMQYLALKALVTDALPPGLKHAFDVAKSERSSLVLIASNAAIGTKLRQLAPRILGHLQAKGHLVNEIQVRVSAQAVVPAHQKAEKTARPLDEQDLKSFEQLQNSLAPGPLADAVTRLINHHKPASSNKTKSQD